MKKIKIAIQGELGAYSHIAVNNLFKERIKKYINLFRKNEFYYFLIFRLAGGLGFPFPIQNILPVIFNMSKINYFFSSLLGFIPHFFIWNSITPGRLSVSVALADTVISIDLSNKTSCGGVNVLVGTLSTFNSAELPPRPLTEAETFAR